MGRSEVCDEVSLKKGPWTPDEDLKLTAYIQQHGHRSWRSLPAKAGLRRCGKSCRLRWTNYLRPGIKRGKFSLQEEQIIIQLHALLGNRWSAIATHLPKRTDNEIKNYWNTHIKKRLAKMGIDPVTHKPKVYDILGCSQPKDVANLSHIAQWESARLEAEARLARQSRFISNHYHSHSLNKANSTAHASPLALPSRPPYLDILKVWQGAWIRPGKDNNTPTKLDGISTTNVTLESPTSILNFSSNMLTVPTGGLPHDNSFIPGTVGNPNNIFENHGKGIMDNSIEIHGGDDDDDVIGPIDSGFVSDSLRFCGFMQGLVDLPLRSGGPSDSNFTMGYCGDFEENDDISYWNNVLNVVTSQTGSPVL